jgi:hypothetical protein
MMKTPARLLQAMVVGDQDRSDCCAASKDQELLRNEHDDEDGKERRKRELIEKDQDTDKNAQSAKATSRDKASPQRFAGWATGNDQTRSRWAGS